MVTELLANLGHLPAPSFDSWPLWRLAGVPHSVAALPDLHELEWHGHRPRPSAVRRLEQNTSRAGQAIRWSPDRPSPRPHAPGRSREPEFPRFASKSSQSRCGVRAIVDEPFDRLVFVPRPPAWRSRIRSLLPPIGRSEPFPHLA